MNPRALVYLAVASASVSLPGRAAPITHSFVAIDEGMGNLLRVDEKDPSKNWIVPINKPHPRDLQLIGANHLLVSTDLGYLEYDLADGKRLKDVSVYHDVSSARRLANGNTLLVGVDFDEEKKNKGDQPLGDPTGLHVLFGEYDPQGHAVRRVKYVGDYARLMRETAAGTYLVACNTMFKEGDADGHFFREIPVDGFTHAWMALRLPNGNTLMSAGYGTSQKKGSSFMIELDSAGKTVRRFGGAGQVPVEEHPYFYAMFQLMPNGDVVAANWQGHGKNHGSSGWQVVEFDPSGAIVWKWSDSKIISSIQAVLVLDGLDTSVVNDERNGVMEPLKVAR